MTATLTSQTVPRPARTRERWLLGIILAGQFMAVLDAAIVNVAIPSIRGSLHASGSGLQLIVAGYVMTYACLLVTGARLGDRFTQRRVFIAGLTVFTLTSLACGLAWSAGSLIGFRIAQGAGAALMVPQVMTLIQRTFTGTARASALSAYATVLSGGAVAGQVLGGVLVSANVFGGWRAVFLVNVPIGLALLVGAWKVLPRGGAATARPLDIPGLLLLSPSVLLMVLPLVLGHEQRWPVWGWIMLAASAVIFALFLLVEQWVAKSGGAPLFPARLRRAPGLVASAAALLLIMTAFGGWLFATTLHFQGGLGYSALRSGLVTVPFAAAFALASLRGNRLPTAWQVPLIPLGLVSAALTMALIGWLLRAGAQFGPVELVLFGICGGSFGLAFSPLMNRALGAVPLAEAADASGLLVTCVQLGLVAGVAACGTLFFEAAGPEGNTAHGLAAAAIAQGVAVLIAAGLAAAAVRRRPAAKPG